MARFLTQYPTGSRAEALHLALQSLRARVKPDRVLACEFAWAMHRQGYWSQIRRADGGAYETEETYFSDVLGLASWRTAYKRLAIGRMLMGFEEPERNQLRAATAAVGLAKATVVVPAIERLREWKPRRGWIEAIQPRMERPRRWRPRRHAGWQQSILRRTRSAPSPQVQRRKSRCRLNQGTRRRAAARPERQTS